MNFIAFSEYKNKVSYTIILILSNFRIQTALTILVYANHKCVVAEQLLVVLNSKLDDGALEKHP